MADLFDHDSSERPPLPGYRLTKLEVYNWGTFDRTVHTVCPQGQNTLLVGENGSGKSTLVDALLTLLVRPQTRNYNVAAGATKNERDERTYIRGAYDRTIGDNGRPQIQYLRSATGHYTALLACFAHAASGNSFTICQILCLGADNSVDKIYAYCDGERSIVDDLAGIASASGMNRELRDRGFNTSTSYKQYFKWIQRKTGFRDKAMDIFNQTVAVKDVQRLDLFIRQHMLESKPWREKVDRLLNHFSELSEAHRMLVRIRQQEELLQPVTVAGKRYTEEAEQVAQAKRLLDACDYFFALEKAQLLTPLCTKWQEQIEFLTAEIVRLERLQDRQRDEIARINVEIENAGGDRLRQLPSLIQQADQLAAIKREARRRYELQLTSAGMEIQITSPEQFHLTRERIIAHRGKLVGERDSLRKQIKAVQYQIGALSKQVSDDRNELTALAKRKNNLPENLVGLRDSICADLRLAPSDLPFAAELISVRQEERAWESSIEQVLHGFARSLLVPGEAYSRVAGYLDRTKLTDGRGRGQRLVYLKVGRRAATMQSSSGIRLRDKLEFRDTHPLAAWVSAEINDRFNLLACESLDEFRRTGAAAMTQNRHFKTGGGRHEKNDRYLDNDRRHFVLGWDNREKRSVLKQAIADAEDDLTQLQQRDALQSAEADQITTAIGQIDSALSVEEFEHLNFEQHEFEASQLRLEKQKLEEADDQIVELKSRRQRLEAEVAGYKADRDAYISKRVTYESELRNGRTFLSTAQKLITQTEVSGRSQEMEAQFEPLRAALHQPLTIENLQSLPEATVRSLRDQHEKLQDRLGPIARDLTSAMTRFLRKFPDEQADLDAHVASLDSFQALYERIAQDDLPKHELRFKRRLNEKVLHEVGLLHGGLEDDRQEIRDKIEQLNGALGMLEWKPGTFMRLEPSDVQDKEIQDFRRELASCLSGTLDGAAEANEATFVRIEKLVEKLRNEGNDRWRQKVMDVRNWFNFAARELVTASGESRSYYDGGTGQSGGEKGKLAFLVLVAAIAYQYDLEPDADHSKRFQFVMVDEMFSRSDDQHAEYALELFERFGLQLLIVAPLDAKARVTEPYVGTYLHVVKDSTTQRSELLSITAEEIASHSGHEV